RRQRRAGAAEGVGDRAAALAGGARTRPLAGRAGGGAAPGRAARRRPRAAGRGAGAGRPGRRPPAGRPRPRGAERGRRPAAAGAEVNGAGARPRREWRTGVEALTPGELRVARLAADGQTNREIAHALYVTLKAVEGHLARGYAKLGITGRAELPQALRPEKT